MCAVIAIPLHGLATSASVVVTVLFWLIVYEGGKVTSLDVVFHGGGLLAMLVDYALCCVPYTVKFHLPVIVVYAFAYFIMTIVYHFADTGSDPIYSVLDWSRPGKAIAWSAGAFAFLLIVYAILWALWRLKLKKNGKARAANDPQGAVSGRGASAAAGSGGGAGALSRDHHFSNLPAGGNANDEAVFGTGAMSPRGARLAARDKPTDELEMGDGALSPRGKRSDFAMFRAGPMPSPIHRNSVPLESYSSSSEDDSDEDDFDDENVDGRQGGSNSEYDATPSGSGPGFYSITGSEEEESNDPGQAFRR